jgi:predicted nuclease of restriction endonuclease-like (RecB) superfamily
LGQYINPKLETAEWGDGVVDELARYLARQHPDLKGFTRRNLFRMRQFYDIYHLSKKLSPLVRELPWTHNLLILSRSKRPGECEFYLRLCLRERWSKRELERQLAGALFERTVLSPPKVSPLVTQMSPPATRENPPGHDRFRVTHHVHPPQYCPPSAVVLRRTGYGGRASRPPISAFSLSAFLLFPRSPVVSGPVVRSPVVPPWTLAFSF